MSANSYLIDTHCHLHDREFFTAEQAEAMLERAHAVNVQKVICIGTNPADSLQACNFANAHKNVFWTYGIHPEYAGSFESCEADMLTSSGQLVAIGEIGLDYHYDSFSRAAQLQLFEQMLQLALNHNLPVSLHIRNAFDDAYAVLDNFPQIKGVIHSFTGSKKDLKKALARDFYIGVNGLVTYTTPPIPPLGRILLETDAPFLTPVPFRGTMNKPSYVREVATYLSEKLGVAETNLMEQTTKNARKIFQIQC